MTSEQGKIPLANADEDEKKVSPTVKGQAKEATEEEEEVKEADENVTRGEGKRESPMGAAAASSSRPTKKQRSSTRTASNANAELERYNYRVAVESWDQIGKLASDVASSVLSQLAEDMSEQIRGENNNAASVSAAVQVPPPAIAHRRNDSIGATAAAVVSSDEEQLCRSSAAAQSGAILPNPNNNNISRSLSSKIDRMARVSKYMMQIDRYHRMLREEMVSITKEATGIPASSNEYGYNGDYD